MRTTYREGPLGPYDKGCMRDRLGEADALLFTESTIAHVGSRGMTHGPGKVSLPTMGKSMDHGPSHGL